MIHLTHFLICYYEDLKIFLTSGTVGKFVSGYLGHKTSKYFLITKGKHKTPSEKINGYLQKTCSPVQVQM